MSNYDWVVQVRITGKRGEWLSTLVDTPKFELRSDPQWGGVWNTPESVARVARDMFAKLCQHGDEINVTVAAADDTTVYQHEVFTVLADGKISD